MKRLARFGVAALIVAACGKNTYSIDKQPALTEAVKDGGKAGLPYETIDSLKDVEQLDKVGNANAIVLAKGNLTVIALP